MKKDVCRYIVSKVNVAVIGNAVEHLSNRGLRALSHEFSRAIYATAYKRRVMYEGKPLIIFQDKCLNGVRSEQSHAREFLRVIDGYKS